MKTLQLLKKNLRILAKKDKIEYEKNTLIYLLHKLLGIEYQLHWNELDWQESEKFKSFLKKFKEEKSFHKFNRWNLSQIIRLTQGVPGDTAECGSYKGAGSWTILSSSKLKVHNIFDSFEGLSEPDKKNDDKKSWDKGDMSVPLEDVKEKLSLYEDRVFYYKGWIPERFEEVSDKKFSFVHIDVDLGYPSIESLRFFYPRMNTGGIILCDDYGFKSCPAVKKEFDAFFVDKEEKMIELADGGGFIIKGTNTGPSIF